MDSQGPEHAYDVKEETPPPAAGAQPAAGTAPTAPCWYAARPGGQREGPMTIEALKQRVSAGTLSPGDLVWRAGMPAWMPARDMPDLFAVPPRPAPGYTAGPAPSGPMPPPMPATESRRSSDNPWNFLPPQLEKLLGRPQFYRAVGRICLVASIPMFLLGGMTLVIMRTATPVTWTLILLLAFLICEVASMVLEKLEQIRTKQDESGGDEALK